MKKSGFYSIALEKINKIPPQTEHYLKFRILRDKGRVLAILNRMPESMQCFEEAEALLGDTKKNNVKYAKLLYLKGLASKRISAKVSTELFEKSLEQFSIVVKTTKNYFISQAIFEMGQILKKEQKFDEAQLMYQEGGKFIKEYFNDPIYGDFSAENHALMQQYFLMQFEWASSSSNTQIEKSMLQKYCNVVEKCNQVLEKDST